MTANKTVVTVVKTKIPTVWTVRPDDHDLKVVKIDNRKWVVRFMWSPRLGLELNKVFTTKKAAVAVVSQILEVRKINVEIKWKKEFYPRPTWIK